MLRCVLFLGFVLATGCASPRQQVCAPPVPAPDARGIIFVADGAGDFRCTSTALTEAIADERLSLQVEVVDWSHGYGRFLADQVDYDHARVEGRRLAEHIIAFRRAYPDRAVDLVAHSAGSAVVLSAAEVLPPGSIDEIILLAPAVSASYDLRPALRCVRRGLEVFSSERDLVYLGAGVAVTGTSDRRWSAAAGRVGFRPLACPEDAALFARLHPHPWSHDVEWTGNHGGHYGSHKQDFLRAYLLPLLGSP